MENERQITYLETDRILPHRANGRQAVVIDSTAGIILKVGKVAKVVAWMDQENLKPAKGKGDMSAGVIMPGLTGAHDHLGSDAYDAVLRPVRLDGIGQKRELLQTIWEYADDNQDLPWIIGRGYDTTKIDLKDSDLNEVLPDRPAIVFDPSNHGAILNSMAQEFLNQQILNLQISRRSIPGSSLNGRITEEYVHLAMIAPRGTVTTDDLAEAFGTVVQSRVVRGVTTLHDMDLRSIKEAKATLLARRNWRKHGVDFPITRSYLSPHPGPKPWEELIKLREKGRISKEDLSRLGIKLYADGSFGSHSAYLAEPYIDNGGKGTITASEQQIREAFLGALEAGLSEIAVHAIGDRAIKRSLRAAQEWLHLSAGQDDTRFRIEHFELPTPFNETLAEAKRLGIWAVLQPNFLLDYNYRDRLGKRVKQISPHRAILEAGIPMMFGTDRMPQSDLFAIWCAVHALYDCQKLTLEEAIDIYTRMPALYEGDNRGEIVEGATADLIVADANFVKIMNKESDLLKNRLQGKAAQEQIDDTIARLDSTIRKVYKDGQVMYNRLETQVLETAVTA